MPDAPDPADAGYVLRRLTARRTVRAAVAAGRLRAGPRAVAEAWRRPLVLDDPGPATARLRQAHLRIAHLSADPLTATTAPGARIDPAAATSQARTLRPDLWLLDAPDVVTDRDLLRALRRAHDAPVVATAEVAAQLGDGAAIDLVLDPHDPDGVLAPSIDHRHDNPVGLAADPDGHGRWRPGDPVPRRGLAVVDVDEGDDPGAAVTTARRAAARGTVVTCRPGGRVAVALGGRGIEVDLGDVERAASALLADTDRRERTSVRQRRYVLAHHTLDDRAQQLLTAAGLHVRPTPRITVLLATRRADLVADALAQVAAQDHPAVDVQLLLHGIDQVPADLTDRAGRLAVQVHHVPADRPLGAVLDVGLEAATGELIAKFDDDDLYGTNHLSDLLVALRYSGADVVGRWANVTYLADADQTVDGDRSRQERVAHHLPGATMLVHGDVLRRLRWRHVPSGVDRELVRALHADGGRAYATHRFGFVRCRHGDHTFAQSDRTFARRADHGTPGLDRSVLEV